eukprot:2439544-Amphidinium_carterae.1
MRCLETVSSSNCGVIGSDRLQGVPISVQPQSSGPVLNSLADGSLGQLQQSNALPSFHTSGGIGSGPSQSS